MRAGHPPPSFYAVTLPLLPLFLAALLLAYIPFEFARGRLERAEILKRFRRHDAVREGGDTIERGDAAGTAESVGGMCVASSGLGCVRTSDDDSLLSAGVLSDDRELREKSPSFRASLLMERKKLTTSLHREKMQDSLRPTTTSINEVLTTYYSY